MGNEVIFEQLRKVNQIGQEYWSARELYTALEYNKWENFLNVVAKAKQACENSGQSIADHFPDVGKMINLAKGATREIRDMHLSRYACYLIIQNADPAKETVAVGQTYFAIQTNKQELLEVAFEKIGSEEEKRFYLRREMAAHNKKLADAAKAAGVIQPYEYAIFQNHGYMGLYNGLDAKGIHKKKGLKKRKVSWTIWAVLSWQPISSGQPKQKIS